MVEPEHPQPEGNHGHERTDAPTRVVMAFALGLIVVAIIIHFLTAGLFKVLNAEKRPGPTISPLSPPRELPPAPRLEVFPQIELGHLQQREDRYLYHYSWVDKQKGIVRIPIDRAIDLVAQQGVPGGVNESSTPTR
jgi:hypothetical protein